MKKVIIIGAGVSGLSAASYFAKEGFEVSVYEKLDVTGGRARVLEREGFSFDMGPTFYWMPDIFEKFFADFGKKVSDFYQLVRLDPGYSVYFGKHDFLQVGADLRDIFETFEKEEPGSSNYLAKFLKQAQYNYRIAMDKVVEKPGKTPFELIMPETVANVSEFMSSVSRDIRKNIKSNKLRQILEFPVIFLGAKPSRTPLFYRFMNYADMELGTWHIIGWVRYAGQIHGNPGNFVGGQGTYRHTCK
jgi:phytoene desaturase